MHGQGGGLAIAITPGWQVAGGDLVRLEFVNSHRLNLTYRHSNFHVEKSGARL